MSTIDTGDENKDVTPVVMTHKAKSEGDEDHQNEPSPNAQPKQGCIGSSEAAGWDSRERRGQTIHLNNPIAETTV